LGVGGPTGDASVQNDGTLPVPLPDGGPHDGGNGFCTVRSGPNGVVLCDDFDDSAGAVPTFSKWDPVRQSQGVNGLSITPEGASSAPNALAVALTNVPEMSEAFLSKHHVFGMNRAKLSFDFTLLQLSRSTPPTPDSGGWAVVPVRVEAMSNGKVTHTAALFLDTGEKGISAMLGLGNTTTPVPATTLHSLGSVVSLGVKRRITLEIQRQASSGPASVMISIDDASQVAIAWTDDLPRDMNVLIGGRADVAGIGYRASFDDVLIEDSP
jgi:hypothetical protein